MTLAWPWKAGALFADKWNTSRANREQDHHHSPSYHFLTSSADRHQTASQDTTHFPFQVLKKALIKQQKIYIKLQNTCFQGRRVRMRCVHIFTCTLLCPCNLAWETLDTWQELDHYPLLPVPQKFRKCNLAYRGAVCVRFPLFLDLLSREHIWFKVLI